MAQKEAELQSIYGSSNEYEVTPLAQFAPRMQLSQASSQAASEAAALFFEDESPKSRPPAPPKSGRPAPPKSAPVTDGLEELMQLELTQTRSKTNIFWNRITPTH